MEMKKGVSNHSVDQYLQKFREVPVLMYHRVVPEPPQGTINNIHITCSELSAQLTSLTRRGFEFVTFQDLEAGSRPRKPVILTFDDGYKDNHDYLLPILVQHRARAVIYAMADRSLRSNKWDIPTGEPEAMLMNDTELKTCNDSGRIEIACHGLQHRNLTELSHKELKEEVGRSKEQLEYLIGKEIVSFAYPYGAYGNREVAAVRSTGYQFAVGTENGPLALAEDRWRVRRIVIFSGTGSFSFWKKSSGFYNRYCRIKGKKDYRSQ